jgi:Bacterial Ig-like domain (group 2)
MKIAACLLLVACGSATGPSLPDAKVTSISSVAITPNTVSTKYGLDAPTQLVANGMLSDGTTKDLSTRVMWSSSNSTIASVDEAGLVTPHLPGMATVTAALGSQSGTTAVTVAAPTMVIGEFGPPGVDFFTADMSGNMAPLRSIRGVNPAFSEIREIAIHGQELFLVDQGNSTIDVYPLDASGDVAPLRKLTGALTTLASPYAIGFKDDEMYIAGGTLVTVFPITATGNVAPSRTITNATTAFASACGLAIVNDELYVTTLAQHTISVFPTNASGSTAPTRTLTMNNTNTTCGLTIVGDEIFVGNQESQTITVFDRTASGPTNALRAIGGDQVALRYTEQVFVLGNELYVPSAENAAIQVYGVEDTSNVAPKRSLIGAATLLADPIGIVMY